MTIVSTREIVDRMRVALPLKVELPDPITGAPFVVDRDNILGLLVVDANNLVFESQIVASMYGEMARLAAAAQRLSDEREVRHRIWKSQRRMECKSKAAAAKEKPPNKEAQEDFYRTHPDYEREYGKANEGKRFALLFGDLKRAFEMKQRALHDLHGVEFGHIKNEVAQDRLAELCVPTPKDTTGYVASADFAEEYRKGNVMPPIDPPKPPAKKKSAKKPRSNK